MQPIEDYTIKRLQENLSVSYPAVRVVRYTECSWGAHNLGTTTFNGENYEEIVSSLNEAIDVMTKSLLSDKVSDVVGVQIRRVPPKEDEKHFIGYYLDIYTGPIKGGDEFAAYMKVADFMSKCV